MYSILTKVTFPSAHIMSFDRAAREPLGLMLAFKLSIDALWSVLMWQGVAHIMASLYRQ